MCRLSCPPHRLLLRQVRPVLLQAGDDDDDDDNGDDDDDDDDNNDDDVLGLLPSLRRPALHCVPAGLH